MRHRHFLMTDDYLRAFSGAVKHDSPNHYPSLKYRSGHHKPKGRRTMFEEEPAKWAWLKARLERVAALDDKRANEHLAKTGSYSCFDEPGSVKIAREILAKTIGHHK